MEMNVSQQDPVIKEISLPLYQSKGWMMFLGVLSILAGIMMAMTIIGIIFAWLPIWIGVLLFQAASTIEEAQTLGRKESILKSLGKLKLYFTIMGIFYLVNLIGSALMILGVLGLGMFGGLMEGLMER